MDYRGLALATGIIRYAYHTNAPDTRIFYRGQRKEWEIKASLYRNCDNRNDLEQVDLWLKNALESIMPVFFLIGTDDER